jgi:hypothetical protein
MKNRALMLLALLLALLTLLSACARGNDGPMEVTVLPESVTPTGLTYRVRRTGESWVFGDEYAIERLVDGQYEPVPELGNNYAFNAIGYVLNPDPPLDSKEMSANWTLMYGELPPGQYRIAKRFLPPKGSGQDELVLYAEFEIKE